MGLDIERILERLMIGENSLGKPVITGFNYHPVCLRVDDFAILTFSNIHSYPNYLAKVLEDLKELGYPNENVSINTRDKIGYFRWKPGFFIRSEDGILEKDLKIKDARSHQYIDLESILARRLEEVGFSNEDIAKFVGENGGYEVNIFLSDERDVYSLASLFLKKSSTILYNGNGDVVFETIEEFNKRRPWPGAWDIPMLIVGGDLSRIKSFVPGFRDAFLFRFQDSSAGEYNFVINKLIGLLKESKEYKILQDLRFREEPCLANIRFIKDYVDVL